MLNILLIIISVVITAIATRQIIMKVHGEKMLADEQKYKTRWLASVDLLQANELVTDDQVKMIMPPAEESIPVERPLHSSDRRDVEIARAKAGLPPGDDLKGMFSSDVTEVMKARIKHGTAS